MSDSQFDTLIEEAEQTSFSGWDFSYLHGRLRHEHPSWDYAALVRARLPGVSALLDRGTGGGEFLAGLAPLPPHTVATEAYAPNVAIARARLAPLGVDVVAVAGTPDNVEIVTGAGLGTLPFAGGSFLLVIDRHESYFPVEVYRILAPGGVFLTQQVGGAHHQALNRLLGAPDKAGTAWNLAFAAAQLAAAGFQIIDQREEFPETEFLDIGAVVYYLKAVPWQVPDFTVDAYRDRLFALHERIETEGSLRIPGHLFYLEAIRPLA